MRVDVVTIFPDYLAPLELSLIGRARRAGLLDVAVHDLRTFTHDRHRTVDDAPLGGGAGMVMRPEPWGEALDHVLDAGRSALGDAGAVPTLLVPSPAGEPFTQAVAQDLAAAPWLAFACGRYEGIDERVLEEAATVLPVRPLSLGDYVLNGGEVAVLAVVEAVARLLPGVLGNADSLTEESHENGLLEYPVYTRPAAWRGREVPAVLLSGHHAQVRRWRRDEQLRRTAARRPDLVAALDPGGLDAADLAVLADCGWTVGEQGRLVRGATAVADWTTVPPAGHALPQGGEAPAPEPPDPGGRHTSDRSSPELRG
jgi:tRNA (guanine37-N1)-methyltransferase